MNIHINENNDLLLTLTFNGLCNPIKYKTFVIVGHNHLIIMKSNIQIDLDINSKIIRLQLKHLFDFNEMLAYDKIKDVNIFIYLN